MLTFFQPFYFPSNAGYSIGAPDDASFYILEMHYDNPKQESGRKIGTKSVRTLKRVDQWRKTPPHTSL